MCHPSSRCRQAPPRHTPASSRKSRLLRRAPRTAASRAPRAPARDAAPAGVALGCGAPAHRISTATATASAGSNVDVEDGEDREVRRHRAVRNTRLMDDRDPTGFCAQNPAVSVKRDDGLLIFRLVIAPRRRFHVCPQDSRRASVGRPQTLSVHSPPRRGYLAGRRCRPCQPRGRSRPDAEFLAFSGRQRSQQAFSGEPAWKRRGSHVGRWKGRTSLQTLSIHSVDRIVVDVPSLARCHSRQWEHLRAVLSDSANVEAKGPRGEAESAVMGRHRRHHAHPLAPNQRGGQVDGIQGSERCRQWLAGTAQ